VGEDNFWNPHARPFFSKLWCTLFCVLHVFIYMIFFLEHGEKVRSLILRNIHWFNHALPIVWLCITNIFCTSVLELFYYITISSSALNDCFHWYHKRFRCPYIHKYFIFNKNNRKRCIFFHFLCLYIHVNIFFLSFIIKLFFRSFSSRLHSLLWGTHSWLRHKHMNSYNNGRCILSFFSFFIPHNVDGMDSTNKMLLKIFLPWWCGCEYECALVCFHPHLSQSHISCAYKLRHVKPYYASIYFRTEQI
jgi:hypothetical protein